MRGTARRVLSAVVFLAPPAGAADVFVRAKVLEPPGERFVLTTGGFRHDGRSGQWYLPSRRIEVAGGAWSEWIDAGAWDLHGRLDRSGGVAEWPAMKLSVARGGGGDPIRGCTLAVQLADRPAGDAVAIAFEESSGSETIGFLLPWPLRERKIEFETGSQMAARHLAWAREATGGRAPALRRFDIITSLWGPYDPRLAERAAETLRLLGFNLVGGAPLDVLRALDLRTYAATWHLAADPEASITSWRTGDGARIARDLGRDEGRSRAERTAYYVVCDEIKTLDFRGVDAKKLDGWFRAYLRERGETDASLGKPIDAVSYPAEAMHAKALPHGADPAARKVLYHAAKFGQRWSVARLRQTTDLVKASFAAADPPIAMATETLPSDHGFFNAWGPPHIGMSYRMLDLFEIGRQEAVDILSAEDWMGLNHMYGPGTTWTGAQSLAYLSAILRSGIGDRRVSLRALITPSDDGYLRLKAYSAIGQGARSLFFWTFGPTSIGTENYWSDLRSMYDGIAKTTRALERAEGILCRARVLRDPVAILYSVSHDIWHADDPASFVETRLMWHALRHLSIQPDFLREEDVEEDALEGYRVLYAAGQCLTRKAADRIDAWVRDGGTLYLAGGAATRDEFFTPRVPSFAADLWPEAAAAAFVRQKGHAYNERADLPGIAPLATARMSLDGTAFDIDVIGCRMDLRDAGDGATRILGRYGDGRIAGGLRTYGCGKIMAVGFLPGLAYSPFERGQTTLDETWPSDPRRIFALPLSIARLRPVAAASVPVVEASLLSGPAGAAVVLANYTYRPIERLRVELRVAGAPARAVSTEGVPVAVEPIDGGVAIELPLAWTDIVLLPAA
ncbi:MAG: hypothetical protein JXP34_15100 [Planctomycetes bacterium]|nr:hypothetical protein [Planctomycetota bacterium]